MTIIEYRAIFIWKYRIFFYINILGGAFFVNFKRYEEIMSKDSIRTCELAELLDVSICTASKIMSDIKAKSDRLNIFGRCHTQDYLDFFCLKRGFNDVSSK